MQNVVIVFKCFKAVSNVFIDPSQICPTPQLRCATRYLLSGKIGLPLSLIVYTQSTATIRRHRPLASLSLS